MAIVVDKGISDYPPFLLRYRFYEMDVDDGIILMTQKHTNPVGRISVSANNT